VIASRFASQRPDLTSDQIWVDGGGKMQVPLVGEVVAGGRSLGDVTRE
jgi:protein involved in polysaccharide export with SLBB domain